MTKRDCSVAPRRRQQQQPFKCGRGGEVEKQMHPPKGNPAEVVVVVTWLTPKSALQPAAELPRIKRSCRLLYSSGCCKCLEWSPPRRRERPTLDIQAE